MFQILSKGEAFLHLLKTSVYFWVSLSQCSCWGQLDKIHSVLLWFQSHPKTIESMEMRAEIWAKSSLCFYLKTMKIGQVGLFVC